MSRELRTGDELPASCYRVDAGPMKVFSVLMADPNPIHFDAEFVARIRRFTCRFGGSVYAGDEVVAGGRVTGVDAHGATMELWLDRAGTGRVLTGTALIAPP